VLAKVLMETPIGAFDLDLSDFELGQRGVPLFRFRNAVLDLLLS
jgi:hypothetical protein